MIFLIFSWCFDFVVVIDFYDFLLIFCWFVDFVVDFFEFSENVYVIFSSDLPLAPEHRRTSAQPIEKNFLIIINM